MLKQQVFRLYLSVDKPNPEKIKEKLAGMNLLVEDWGGKFNLMIFCESRNRC
jgi:hypothetical protein